MQDKIQEIMGLVDDFGVKAEAYNHQEVTAVELISARRLIESKLRELVREPLDAHEVGCLVETSAYPSTEHQRRADFINGIRYAERAHNITNASGVK